MADKARCLRWIIGELPELEQRQLISAEQKAGLLEYYSGRLAQVRSQKHTSASKYFGFMLWLIGTLFIAGGLILAVSYNWNMLSRCLRLALGMLPLVCGTLLGIWTICRKESSQILKEGLKGAVSIPICLGTKEITGFITFVLQPKKVCLT